MKERVLVFGGSGLVGSRVVELLSDQFDIIAPPHRLVDVTNYRQMMDYIDWTRPSRILNCSGYTSVDGAELWPGHDEKVSKLNIIAPRHMATEAAGLGIPLYHLSTDYVFGGFQSHRPYTENDGISPVHNAISPSSVYAKSKRFGEQEVLDRSSMNCILRIIMPYRGSYDKKLDLARLTLQKLQKGEGVMGVTDQNVNPILVDDLVWAMAGLLREHAHGIYHLGAADYTTPYDFMVGVARRFDLNEELIVPTTFEEFSKTRPAKRPQHSWLDTIKFTSEFGQGILHSVEEGLTLFRKQFQF